MSARDELAQLIVAAYTDEGDTVFPPREKDKDVADALIAAGYRKPRTITTAEELAALPELSVVIDCDGDPWQKDEGAWSNGPKREGSRLLSVYAPLVIVHSPEPSDG